jgi:hypothetical protein
MNKQKQNGIGSGATESQSLTPEHSSKEAEGSLQGECRLEGKGRRLSGDKNQCPTCHHYFNSSFAFGRHRVGEFNPNTRRCLTPEEMRAKGMLISSTGFWITEARVSR